jgi:MFS family permease
VCFVDDPRSTGSTRRIPILAMLGATGLSMTGNVLTFMAVPWFVLQTTGSASKTGLTGGVVVLGMVLGGFFGGPLVDRLGFKRASVVADLASGVTVTLIPLFHLTVGLAFWQLLALVLLGTCLDTPGMTARQSLVPELADRARMPVERANSALQAIEGSSDLLGPPLAGVLIAFLGATNVLFLDAATFVVSAATIAVAVPRSDRAPAEAPASGGRYLAELLEGLRFIRSDRLIFSIVVFAMILNFLDSPIFLVVLPVYADANFGSAVVLGVMFAGFGAGSLASTLLFGALGHRLPRRATLIACFVAVGLPFFVLATIPSLPVAVAALAVTGLAAGPLNPIIFTVVQERTPEWLRGRVIGALWALALAVTPVGVTLVGYLLEAVGLRPVLIAVAVGYLMVTLSMLLDPALREMERSAGVAKRAATEESNT